MRVVYEDNSIIAQIHKQRDIANTLNKKIEAIYLNVNEMIKFKNEVVIGFYDYNNLDIMEYAGIKIKKDYK